MSKKLTLLTGLLLCSCAQTPTKNPNEPIGAVLVNGNATVSTQAPAGWQLEATQAVRLDLCALYIKAGTSFDESPAVLYSRASEFVGREGIDKELEGLSLAFKHANAKFTREKKPSVTTKNGLTFSVTYFLNGPHANGFQAVAYTLVKNHAYEAVYSSMKQEDFDANIQAFYDYLEVLAPVEVRLKSFEGKCLYIGPDGKLIPPAKPKHEVPFMDNV